jgi:hypothetical protein
MEFIGFYVVTRRFNRRRAAQAEGRFDAGAQAARRG